MMKKKKKVKESCFFLQNIVQKDVKNMFCRLQNGLLWTAEWNTCI